MSDKYRMSVGVNIDTNPSSDPKAQQINPGTPFRIAVLGDFSGRGYGQDNSESVARRRLIEIDRDNFEEVMASFNITLNLEFNDMDSFQIRINELEDFHPDELYEKLESFSRLRGLRRRLTNNNTFADAAAELQTWHSETQATEGGIAKPRETTTTDSDATVDEVAQVGNENFLDSILDSQPDNPSATLISPLDQLVKSIVAPYVEPAADPRQDELISMVDRATESHMRDILHHPDFQALESAWRSLLFLIKRLETGTKLKIMILDITKQELQSELAVDDIAKSAIYQLFCDPAAGDLPWGLLLGNYCFGDKLNDVLSLVSIAGMAQQAGAPFLAAARETLAGCESFSSTPEYDDWSYEVSEGVNKVWQMLRLSPVAPWIGLALPRFLLRLPYGSKSKPVDSFTFEEMPDEQCHECYLWGNAAFIKAELLARSFIKHGWQMQPGEEYQTDNLPLYFYDKDGETINLPVAEILLTERAGNKISGQGLMPLWSVKNSDSIRSSDFRSVAEDGTIIAGHWS